MKNALLLLVLAILAIACQKDESIGPPKLLYQRWHLDRTKPIGSEAWIVYNLDGIYDTEYRPDGTLVHRKDGVIQTMTCCSASRFERNGARINYLDFAICPQVRCSGSQTEVTITFLSDQLLELTTDQRVTQYKAVR